MELLPRQRCALKQLAEVSPRDDLTSHEALGHPFELFFLGLARPAPEILRENYRRAIGAPRWVRDNRKPKPTR